MRTISVGGSIILVASDMTRQEESDKTVFKDFYLTCILAKDNSS